MVLSRSFKLKSIYIPLIIGSGIVLLIWVACGNIYLNISSSLPIGIYCSSKTDKTDSSLHRGDYVVIKLPNEVMEHISDRKWIPKGYLIKQVYGLPGDRYEVYDNISINGRYIGPVFDNDSLGIPLPQHKGSHIVLDNNFLPMATYLPNSFDGRYFGDISQKFVIEKVKPLIIFGI